MKMKIAIISSKTIAQHPTGVLSAEYWVNIANGKLPYTKDAQGRYTVVSHTTNLKSAKYMTAEQADKINEAIDKLAVAKAELDEMIFSLFPKAK